MPEIEDTFKALGDQIRIRIVSMLAKNGEMCVCKIMEGLEMSQPAVSHHLSTLKHAGLVTARREGQRMHYSLCCDVLSKVPIAFLQDVVERLESCCPKPSTERCDAECCAGSPGDKGEPSV